VSHTLENRKPLLSRVRRMQGQLAALEKALEEGVECNAALQQIAAVRGAVNGLMLEVLQGHLQQHLAPTEQPASEDLEVVMKVLRSYLR